MRGLTKTDYYWERAMEEAVNAGFTEFAMTLNPFPGAIEHATKLATMAKKKGFKTVNVTTVLIDIFVPRDQEHMGMVAHEDVPIAPLLPHIDILTLSVDDMRHEDLKTCANAVFMVGNVLFNLGYGESIHYNVNLLWTPTVFEWARDSRFERILYSWVNYPSMGAKTLQHLIYKPLSIYESVDWFWENYNWVLENLPEIHIAGNGDKFLGDVALNNMLGLNACPGANMVDIDPMGFARRCPENPVAHPAQTIEELKTLLSNGVPGCGEKCNCITPK